MKIRIYRGITLRLQLVGGHSMRVYLGTADSSKVDDTLNELTDEMKSATPEGTLGGMDWLSRSIVIPVNKIVSYTILHTNFRRIIVFGVND